MTESEPQNTVARRLSCMCSLQDKSLIVEKCPISLWAQFMILTLVILNIPAFTSWFDGNNFSLVKVKTKKEFELLQFCHSLGVFIHFMITPESNFVVERREESKILGIRYAIPHPAWHNSVVILTPQFSQVVGTCPESPSDSRAEPRNNQVFWFPRLVLCLHSRC